MAGTRVTVTLSEGQVKQIRKMIKNWPDCSVSGFIRSIVSKTLENSWLFDAEIEEALRATGGPSTPEEREWARNMVRNGGKLPRRRKAA